MLEAGSATVLPEPEQAPPVTAPLAGTHIETDAANADPTPTTQHDATASPATKTKRLTKTTPSIPIQDSTRASHQTRAHTSSHQPTLPLTPPKPQRIKFVPTRLGSL